MGDRPLQFGLLGQLEVDDAGTPVVISSPKHRILLAMLLAHANRLVPTGKLAAAIWADRPPANPRRAVQLCVTRLRTLLPGPPVIVTGDDGYLLDVPPDQTDLGRFLRWLREADEAAAGADHAREATALRAALALWRGDPLTNVSSDALHDDIVPRLREQRLYALERRFAADLVLGRHAEIVGEVHAATVEHPLRERFWVQLMTALHLDGRRAAALAAFHSGRQHLTDELGIEPGEQMRQLHVTILGHSPGSGAPPGVPRQLPPETAAFTGRGVELTRLTELTTEPHAGVVVISGTAGVGKTALAVRWARRNADRFPDGQLWVDLRGYDHRESMSSSSALVLFLRALGIADAAIPPDLDARTGLYRSVLDGRRMLVVIDNARTADQVRPLLPGSPGSVVVVTSRDQLTGLLAAGARPLALDLLSAAQSADLLRGRLGAALVAAEPAAVTQIVDRCAGLPLALAIAASRAAQRTTLPLTVVAERLGASLDELSTVDAATNVRAVFSWSYRTLSTSAARLFRHLAAQPGRDAPTGVAESLVAGAATPLLDELIGAHLVTEHRPGRYSMHDLLRAYAIELTLELDGSAGWTAATRRVLDHHLRTAHAAALLVDPTRAAIPCLVAGPAAVADRTQAMAWFDAEYQNLLAAVERAASSGFDTHTWQLAWALADFQQWRGLWHDRAATLNSALAATERLGDPTERARAHRGLGYAHTKLRDSARAQVHFGHALELYRALDDPHGQTRVHHGLSAVLERAGDHRMALWHAQRALELCTAAGNPAHRARAVGLVGWCHAQLGDHRQAMPACRQALELARTAGDAIAEATSCDSLGFIHHQLGEHQTAADYYETALDLRRILGHRSGEASTLTKLGATRAELGELGAALRTWRSALLLLEQLGEPADRVRAELRRLGDRALNTVD